MVKLKPRRPLKNSEKTLKKDDTKTPKLGNYFSEYLMHSTLHGLRYIGDVTLSLFERCFFVIAFITVVLLSAYFISNVYEKWSDTPIIISSNPQATPLQDIPFPAVTICNMNRAKKSVVKEIPDGSLDESLLQSVCAGHDYNISNTPFVGKWSTFRTFLLRVSHPCNEMLVNCRYAMETEECMDIFETVLTDDGICCTFNSVYREFMINNVRQSDVLDTTKYNDKYIGVDWTPEKGFPPNVKNFRKDQIAVPRPASGAGYHMGLSVVLDANVPDYHCSSTDSAGFKILLHNPTETPKIADFGFVATPNTELRVIVNPKISDANHLIRRVDKKIRQCVFANEGNLSYYRTYTKKNCEMECESTLTEQSCGCVQYYMPRNTEETNICSRNNIECYTKIKLAVDLLTNRKVSCSCLPACFEIAYDRSISTAILSDGSFETVDDIFVGRTRAYVKKSITILHISFMSTAFHSSTKGELIGFTEFLSNTGGLLGLFMGFSVVSFIEIIYYLSIKPYFQHKRLNTNQIEPIQEMVKNNLNSSDNKYQNWNLFKNQVSFKIAAEKLRGVRDKIRNVGTILKDKYYETPTYPYFE